MKSEISHCAVNLSFDHLKEILVEDKGLELTKVVLFNNIAKRHMLNYLKVLAIRRRTSCKNVPHTVTCIAYGCTNFHSLRIQFFPQSYM